MRLEVLNGDHVVHSCTVGADGVRIGRSSTNDLVLRDAGVSGHHAVVWTEGDQLVVRDLGSTNGTFLRERRLDGPTSLAEGDVLALGPDVRLRVAGGGVEPGLPMRVVQVDGPVAHSVRAPRLALPGGELLFREDGTWLAIGGEEVAQIELDAPFTCGDQRWVLEEDHHTATVRPSTGPLPYRLEVDLGRDEALLSEGSRTCRFRADHRVALLAALATRRRDDPPGPGRGWVEDDELRRAIWGRARWDKLPNNLNVLVHRVRAQAERAGFERWFVERRPGRTRLHVAGVTLR
ncbi:MAG: FHA domain-containing protein [Alphaproteobacteria bacterium]|nr:FHA domain-containing protein [Alphaproteobacteria bacterium]MCB9699088.1 FHA domain-containing protein [Alphaproteobacteria bacterium]